MPCSRHRSRTSSTSFSGKYQAKFGRKLSATLIMQRCSRELKLRSNRRRGDTSLPSGSVTPDYIQDSFVLSRDFRNRDIGKYLERKSTTCVERDLATARVGKAAAMSHHPDCAICGLPMDDPSGHNAMPVRAGRCCNQCDDEVVMVARLVLLGVNSKIAKLAGRELYRIKFKEKPKS